VSPSPSPPVYNAYILDSQSLPRPKSFSREFISISRDVRTIDGKEGRDMSHRKERYILGWDTLSAYNVSRILTIIDKDTAVTFAISEENLTILSTNVLVKLVSIDYITPGENYLAELVIELLEVE